MASGSYNNDPKIINSVLRVSHGAIFRRRLYQTNEHSTSFNSTLVSTLASNQRDISSPPSQHRILISSPRACKKRPHSWHCSSPSPILSALGNSTAICSSSSPSPPPVGGHHHSSYNASGDEIRRSSAYHHHRQMLKQKCATLPANTTLFVTKPKSKFLFRSSSTGKTILICQVCPISYLSHILFKFQTPCI